MSEKFLLTTQPMARIKPYFPPCRTISRKWMINGCGAGSALSSGTAVKGLIKSEFHVRISRISNVLRDGWSKVRINEIFPSHLPRLSRIICQESCLSPRSRYHILARASVRI